MPPTDDNPADLPRARPVERDSAPEYEPEPDEEVSSNDKTTGMLAHLLGLFTWVIGPAVLLFTQGDKSPFVARHAKEALNCQVTQIFYYIAVMVVCGLIGGLVYVLSGKGVAGLVVGYVAFILAAIAFAIFELICIIKGAIAASKGLEYRYPLTIRLF